MVRSILALVFLVAVCIAGAAAAQATMGYDAHGRLICVYHPTATPKITRYAYDAAGNRTSRTVVAAAGQTCGSQPVGPAPSLPIQLTSSNLSESIASDSARTWAMTALGSSSDSATLSLISASTSGSAGACGAVTVSATALNYSAPTLNPAGATLSCYVDYVFQHPNNQQKSGRITLTITGVNPPGGGGGGGGEDPPPDDPRTECHGPHQPEYCAFPPPGDL